MPYEFPFERAAMRGEVPEGLDLLQTGACHKLVEIYKRFYAAGRTDEAKRRAQMEKAELVKDYKFDAKLTRHRAATIKATEIAASNCRKNPTRENALALCEAIDGVFENAEIVAELRRVGLY